eukprot:1179025-Prorocentrum_minimum.AAC.2
MFKIISIIFVILIILLLVRALLFKSPASTCPGWRRGTRCSRGTLTGSGSSCATLHTASVSRSVSQAGSQSGSQSVLTGSGSSSTPFPTASVGSERCPEIGFDGHVSSESCVRSLLGAGINRNGAPLPDWTDWYSVGLVLSDWYSVGRVLCRTGTLSDWYCRTGTLLSDGYSVGLVLCRTGTVSERAARSGVSDEDAAHMVAAAPLHFFLCGTLCVCLRRVGSRPGFHGVVQRDAKHAECRAQHYREHHIGGEDRRPPA